MTLIPWKIYIWAAHQFGLCWASCVSLKLYGLRSWIRDHGETWRVDLYPSRICFMAHPEPYDYCGMYGNDHPRCRELLAEIGEEEGR